MKFNTILKITWQKKGRREWTEEQRINGINKKQISI